MNYRKWFFHILVGVSISLLSTSAESFTKLYYQLFLKNSDNPIHCDLLFIQGNSVQCRQSRGLTIYPYDSAQTVIVYSGNKTFVFKDELKQNKAALMAAFDTLNSQKLEELGAIARAKQEEEVERQRIEGEAASIQFDSGENYQPGHKTSNQVVIDLSKKIAFEKRRLRERMEEARGRCKTYIEESAVIDRYNKIFASLEKDPEYYFYRQGAESKQTSRPRGGGGSSTSRAGGGSSSASNFGNCSGDCLSDLGICTSSCMGNPTCISNCSMAQARCQSRCR